MINNAFVSITSLFLLIQSFFLTAYIIKIIYEKKHTPVQLNWLGEACFLLGVLQIFLLFHNRIFGLSHYLNFAAMIYYSLYLTRFNTTKNDRLQKKFILLSHVSYDFLIIFFFASVFADKYNINQLNNNLYLILYNIRYILLGLMVIILALYTVISLKDENLRPSVKHIQYCLLVANIMIFLSYILKKYYPILYVTYSIIMIITNTIIWYHISIEKGRFLDE